MRVGGGQGFARRATRPERLKFTAPLAKAKVEGPFDRGRHTCEVDICERHTNGRDSLSPPAAMNKNSARHTYNGEVSPAAQEGLDNYGDILDGDVPSGQAQPRRGVNKLKIRAAPAPAAGHSRPLLQACDPGSSWSAASEARRSKYASPLSSAEPKSASLAAPSGPPQQARSSAEPMSAQLAAQIGPAELASDTDERHVLRLGDEAKVPPPRQRQRQRMLPKAHSPRHTDQESALNRRWSEGAFSPAIADGGRDPHTPGKASTTKFDTRHTFDNREVPPEETVENFCDIMDGEVPRTQPGSRRPRIITRVPGAPAAAQSATRAPAAKAPPARAPVDARATM